MERERDVRKRLKNTGAKARQRAYERYTEERSRNHICREKAINITHPKCVSVALVIQHAKRMCHIMMIYLTVIGLTPGGSSIVHIYTQKIHRTTQLTTLVGRLFGIRTQSSETKFNDELTAQKLSYNWEECGPCPVFASYTLAFALQLKKKHGKTSVRYFRLWLVRLYSMCIPQVILQKARFSRNVIEHKSVFLFSIQRMPETLLMLRKIRQVLP